MARTATSTYTYRITFRAPVDFVYRWCTDYGPDDARLEGETYHRKVLARSPRRVVFEDLEEGPEGWFWAHHEVRLFPPNRWRSVSVGNRRKYRLEYELRELPGDRTELRFRGQRRPWMLGTPNPSARAFQREMDSGWKRFRTHLEREYRRRPRRARPRSARSRARRGARRG